MRLPKYGNYKASGIDWLPEIPAHWDVCALKRVASFQSGESITAEQIEDVGVYPVYGGNGLRGFTAAFTHEGRFALIGRQGALCGNVNYSQGKFWASEHAVVATPLKPVNTTWLGELLRAMNLNQYSVSAAQPGLSVDLISRIAVPYPPLDEQTAIAAFLDRETTKINELIVEQEKLISLLTEKRQATISHAVTRGLNPNVPMKDSGVAWLGEVPAHWDVATFQRYVYVQEGQVNPEEEPYRSMLLIAPNHIESSTGRLLYVETAHEQSAESGKYLCKSGDVIYSKIRPALRKVCIAPEDCLCSADMYPLRGTSTLSNSFLKWFMLSEPFSALAVLESERVAMPKINRESLKAVWLPVPPPHEQEAIGFFLLTETAKLDALKDEASRAIKLLAERRSTLIAAAVTGQIDLRGTILQFVIETPEAIAA